MAWANMAWVKRYGLSKDMALKDVPFVEAILSAGLSKVDPFTGDISDESYYCSDRMPCDSGSDAMQRMQHNFEHEFFPLDRIRLADLLDETGFNSGKLYFKTLGFSGYVAQKR